MKGRIPQAFLDEVLVRTDLVELIDSRVPLKKSGHNYSACCPFHNEKTASFNIDLRHSVQGTCGAHIRVS